MRSNHKKGASLKPGGKFAFKHARVPMRKPRRTKKHHGRRGGVRG